MMLWDHSVWAMTFLHIPLAMSDLPVYPTDPLSEIHQPKWIHTKDSGFLPSNNRNFTYLFKNNELCIHGTKKMFQVPHL